MIADAPKSSKPRVRQLGHLLVRMFRGVFMLEDTPRRIALGTAIGLFFAWQPFVGSQMAVTAVVSKVCRANVLAGLPWVWISNPLTIVPLYYFAYRLGCLVYMPRRMVAMEELPDLQALDLSFWETIKAGFSTLMHIALPMQIGGTIIGLVCAIPGYFIIRSLVNLVQRRRSLRRRRWLDSLMAAERAAPPSAGTES